MLKRRFIYFILAAFLGLAVQAAAATPAATLPPRVLAHVSVRSVVDLKRGLFRLVDSSTKGTQNHVPAEFLEMITQMSLPFSTDIWKSDEPTHLFVMEGGRNPNLALVFSVESFEDLVDDLMRAGFEFSNPVAGDGYEAVLPVTLPNGLPMLLVDLGDGKGALANRLDDVAVVAKNPDWTPTHETPADAYANIALGLGNTDLAGKLAAAMEESYEKTIQELEEIGISREAAANMLDLAKKYFPVLATEMGKATNLLVELTCERDRLILDFGVRSADGSFLKALMERAEKLPPVATALTTMFPGQPVSLVANAPMENLIPDPEAFFAPLVNDFLERFPARKEEMTAASRRVWDAKAGNHATANYLFGDRQVQYTLMEMRDAAGGYDGMVALTDAFGKTLSGFFANPEESVDLAGEAHARDGFAWHTFTIVPRSEAKFREFIGRVEKLEESRSLIMQFVDEHRIHIAALPESSLVVIAGGPLDEDEFLSLLRETAQGGADRFATPGAAKVLADVKGGQIGRGLLDPDGAFLLFAAQKAKMELALDEENPAGEILERMADELEPGDADVHMGLGAGAGSGWLLGTLSVPAKAVNMIILDYEKYQSLLREAGAWEEEEEEEEGDEEEIVLEIDDDAA